MILEGMFGASKSTSPKEHHTQGAAWMWQNQALALLFVQYGRHIMLLKEPAAMNTVAILGLQQSFSRC